MNCSAFVGRAVLDISESGAGVCASRLSRAWWFAVVLFLFSAPKGSAEEPSKFARFESTCVEFFKEHEIPGAAVALTDGGEIVFAKGFGVADLSAETPVTPDSLFRIASVSKPITAVAVVRLAQEGRLSLDDKISKWFDLPGANENFGGEPADARLKSITVRMLLEHRGGWDREVSYDPMFRSRTFAERLAIAPPADANAVIQVMMGEPLDFTPGERYAYSNFGYCLLGRIIERVTGAKYEDYVRKEILKPMGIEGMRVGHTRIEGRWPGEVCYYHPGKGTSVFAENLGEEVPHPYGAWCLEAMDSHGGWVASASDLARFAIAIEPGRRSPVLEPGWLERLYQPPANFDGNTPVYYSLGWQNRILDRGRGTNHWHTGSLPGTTSIVILGNDGRNMIALLNTRHSSKTKNLGLELDKLLQRAAATVAGWRS